MHCSKNLPSHAVTWALHAATWALLLGTQRCSVAASRVLVVIPNCLQAPNSHLFMLNRVVQELAQRGHSVGVAGSDWDAPYIAAHPNVTLMALEGRLPPGGGFKKDEDLRQNLWARVRLMAGHVIDTCDRVLSNASYMQQLKGFKAEAVLGDQLDFCLPLISSKLDLPQAKIGSGAPADGIYNTWWRRSGRRNSNPIFLGFTPVFTTGYTQHMTLLQRLKNSWRYALISAADTIFARAPYTALQEKHGINLDSPKERARDVLHLLQNDLALEWPVPRAPHVFHVGPVLPGPAAPLPQDLEEFMSQEAGGNGTLLIATGSTFQLSWREIKDSAEHLEKLPMKVLWKLTQKEQDSVVAQDPSFRFGSNIKVVKWLPQNDVLGHPQTRAFLSHAGANSIYEAAYHGVPVVALPLGADQWDMTAKAETAGFAIGASKGRDTPPSELAAAVQRVATDPAYREAAKKVSTRLRAREYTPLRKLHRIEHMIATKGDPYMRCPMDELPFLVRYSLDVAALWLLALFAAVAALLALLRLCLRLAIRLVGGPRVGRKPKTA